MKILPVAALILALGVLSGCQATVRSPEHGSITIKDKNATASESKMEEEKFCPPGQAKKGKC